MKRGGSGNMYFKASIAAVVLAASCLVAAAGVGKGDSFPALSGKGLEGPVPNLSGNVVLVDFWASWCGPCKKSFPALERLQKTYGSRGFMIVAVSVDEEAEAMEGFLESHPVSFNVVRDAEQKLVAETGVEAMPTSFLIRRDGKVAAVHLGFDSAKTEKELAAEIERLLK